MTETQSLSFLMSAQYYKNCKYTHFKLWRF